MGRSERTWRIILLQRKQKNTNTFPFAQGFETPIERKFGKSLALQQLGTVDLPS
ncbi:hypothetical protein C943_04206 [Mariniradius saccharolyticus AK6]|uniref:Uncharacterized protein n=1 Tax=Mariniradius saccharolyticus AK6 TaxID=1239962 RepID=M7XZI0_9BACT|nr:hypothetical protein C943_04206 [Mariniradius saccharolyticus AK6]